MTATLFWESIVLDTTCQDVQGEPGPLNKEERSRRRKPSKSLGYGRDSNQRTLALKPRRHAHIPRSLYQTETVLNRKINFRALNHPRFSHVSPVFHHTASKK